MSTIVRSVAAGLSLSFEEDRDGSPDRSAVAVHEAVGLIDLATQLLTSDNNGYRVRTLLSEVSPPLVCVLSMALATDPTQLGHDGSRVHRACMDALRAVLTLATGDTKQCVLSEMIAGNIAELVVRHLALMNEESISCAAEILFMLSEKVELDAEIVAAGAIDVLAHVTWSPRAPLPARRCAAATLIKCCEAAAEDVLPIVFPRLADEVNHATLHEELSWVVLDLIALLWQGDPMGAIRAMNRSGATASFFRRACAAVGALESEETLRGCTALQALVDSLQTCDWWDADDAFDVLLNCDAISHCLNPRGASETLQCRCEALLSFCKAARGPSQLDGLVHCVIRSSTAFSFLLSLASGVPPRGEGTSAQIQQTAVLVTSLLLAKSARFRLRVHQAAIEYETWLVNFRATLTQEVEVAFDTDSARGSFTQPIIDSSGLLLNSVNYVDESAPRAWCDMGTMEALLHHLFSEQQRAGGFAATQEGAEPFQTQPCAPPVDRMAFLSFAVLCFAVQLTFSNPPQRTSKNTLSTHATECIDGPPTQRSCATSGSSAKVVHRNSRPSVSSVRSPRPWR